MSSSSTTTQSNPPAATTRPRKGIDADALLRSLAPVVAKPESNGHARQTSSGGAERPQHRPEPASEADQEPQPVVEKPRRSRSRTEETPESRPASGRARATLDVEINPGEGSTAIYVRVPRTTHVALKILALQNQASMDGPTELASMVRTAIAEYLDRQERRREKAA